jgi:hypothetical protein
MSFVIHICTSSYNWKSFQQKNNSTQHLQRRINQVFLSLFKFFVSLFYKIIPLKLEFKDPPKMIVKMS